MNLKAIKWFTFQEVLNLYPARAPEFPHDKNTPADWFSKMIDDAGMELAVYTLSEFFTDSLITEIIDALMTIVYYRHDEDYFFKVESDWREDYELQQADFRPAMKKLMSVIDLTLPRYIPLLQQNEYASTDPIAPVSSVSTSKTRFNDTPQDGGLYENDPHTTNLSQTENETSVDSASLMERLEQLFKNFRSIILEWSNEFNMLFFKEEQIL